VEDLAKVGVVDMSKDAEELFVDVFCCRGEGGLEISAWKGQC
jgi:hypothetical protein